VTAKKVTTDVGSLSKLQLWEYGRRKLGYGDWTSDHPDPYPKWAGLEAHKLFLVMRKRNISQAEFMLCVDYCHRHHLRIENAIWVFKYYTDAKHEFSEQVQVAGLPKFIDEAIAYEQALAAADSQDWIAKLTRAAGSYREEVLNEWRIVRAQSLQTVTG